MNNNPDPSILEDGTGSPIPNVPVGSSSDWFSGISDTLKSLTQTYQNTKAAIAAIKSAGYVGGKGQQGPTQSGPALGTAVNYTPYIVGGAAIIAIILVAKGK